MAGQDARRRRRRPLPRRVRGGRRRRARPTTIRGTCPIRCSCSSAPARSAPPRSSSRSMSASRTRGRRRDRRRRSTSARSSSATSPRIEEIEQRAYPTPWSRSMFASELAKPTSICLGAFEGDELVGYVINSRYVDAWHIMNVAVVARSAAPRHRDRAPRAPVRADAPRRAARFHARGARLQRRGDPPLRGARLRGARRPARVLHGQSGGRARSCGVTARSSE